jgi:hypothetical protein
MQMIIQRGKIIRSLACHYYYISANLLKSNPYDRSLRLASDEMSLNPIVKYHRTERYQENHDAIIIRPIEPFFEKRDCC